MSRRFIRQGDKTDRNGVVVEGIVGTSFQGQPFAYLGAPVLCPACGTTGVIISDGSPRAMTMMGKQVALENDLCQCKCEPLPKLVASQTLGSIKT
ncbi:MULTISPECIES: PAAR domain-containing protein [Burkholderia]|uniref:PAAR domain-containing protein n=1 Tax=Burkholderia TaxID=32008 RepID=UPI0009BFB0E9|nr:MULTISPECIES: PAAR domain-containing protein [Burkholderia]MBF3496265.1 PAAR domain-containing protein [Burkholderia pseudomallei]MDA0561717.1 PAAR domain-containing protein [Burkholderia pseudomallei]NVH69042.1 PAAR domain-containing protein [Burkholderia pseudomallei]